jgi:TRAP-type C4-dicarboxylate transport system permease small subunit
MSIVLFNQEFLDKFREFTPMVEPDRFLSLAVQLLLAGFVCVIAFVSYEVIHSTSKSRSLVKEISIATVASILLGVGSVMAGLGLGLYI